MPVKERPIIFNADMVRAILDGRKNQTRRVIKPQPDEGIDNVGDSVRIADSTGREWSCPYGVPGNHLWVRETWHTNNTKEIVHYRAEFENGDPFHIDECGEDCSLVGEKWRPSIHMPRWASRILLKVTDVRVERVQEISEDDAVSEGVIPSDKMSRFFTGQYRSGFQDLWDSINAKRGYGWDTNPWVWVVNFEMVQTPNQGER